MPEPGRIRRFRLGIPSSLRFAGTTWSCVAAVLLGIFSLGYTSIADRRRDRAAAWLRSAGADVRADDTLYWDPPLGPPRTFRTYRVRFPPSTTLTPYEIESLFALPGLRTLDLSSNPVDDELASKLARIRTLETLKLNRTLITDAGLRLVAQLPSLKILSVGATPTTARAVREVARQRGWPGFYTEWIRWQFWQRTGEAARLDDRSLEITPKTKLNSKAVELLREMPGLEEIVVIQRTPPIEAAHWRSLGNATHPRRLNIQAGIDRAGAAGLSAFKTVEEIKVVGADLDDTLFRSVPLDNLRSLTVDLGRYDASGLAHLKGAPYLERLTLSGPVREGNDSRSWQSGSAATGAGLLLQAYRQGSRYEALQELPNLRVLTLGKVALDAAAIGHLSRIPDLQEINLVFVYVVDMEAVEALKLLGEHPTLKRIVLPRYLPENKLFGLVKAIQSSRPQKRVNLHSRNPGIRNLLKSIPGVEPQP